MDASQEALAALAKDEESVEGLDHKHVVPHVDQKEELKEQEVKAEATRGAQRREKGVMSFLQSQYHNTSESC